MSDSEHVHKGRLSITFDEREVHTSPETLVMSDATVEAIADGLKFIHQDKSNTLHRIVMRTICDECGHANTLITVEGNWKVLDNGFEEFKKTLGVVTAPEDAYFTLLAMPIVEHAATRANAGRLKQVMERIFPGRKIMVVRVVRD